SFFGRQEVKDLMAYLRLLVNPDDDNAYLRVMNVPRREIGSTNLEKLGNYSTERGISMYAYASLQALAAAFNGAKSNKGEDAATWLKANTVKTVMGDKKWDSKGDLTVSDYVVYQW
ncbi:3'-5' exonuclease, partial [Paraburkholderia sp. SIMBA_049]